MKNKIGIIEAPFLEPGMPYPETVQWGALLCAHGLDAVPIDLNVRLYRAIMDDSTPILDQDQLTASMARACFLDERQLLHRMGHAGSGADSLDRMMDLCTQAADFFSGSGPHLTHAAYVANTGLINGLLDYRMKQFDCRLSLWLDAFVHPVGSHDAAGVLGEASSAGGEMQRVFETYLARALDLADVDMAFVAIRSEEQLLPGLALAHWLGHQLHKKVAVGGRYLETVLALNMTQQIFDVCDSVVLGPTSSNLVNWATDRGARKIYSNGPAIAPDPWLLHGLEDSGARTSAHGQMATYLSPIDVAGLRATSRCYWSRCTFCSLACERSQPLLHTGPDAFAERLRQLDRGDGVRHFQFMDYALPPIILNAAARKCGALDIRWAAQLRFEQAFLRRGCFADLHRLGCRAVAWGFESGSSDLLHEMCKGGAVAAVSRAAILRESAQAGISNHLFVIVGYPGESESDFAATLEFIAHNLDCIHSVEVHAYQPIAGTPACQALEAEGAVFSLGDWSPRLAYREARLEEIAGQRKAIVSEIALSLGGLHRTSDLLEGHMSFQYLWRRGADK